MTQTRLRRIPLMIVSTLLLACATCAVAQGDDLGAPPVCVPPGEEIDGDPSPLVKAVQAGDLAEVRRLVDDGAEVDQQYAGVTPLFWAVRLRHADIVELLLEHGAAADAVREVDGWSLLHQCARLASETDPPEPPATVGTASPVGLAKMLLEHGAEPDQGAVGYGTPLHLAAGAGQLGLVNLLLDAGATVDVLHEPEFADMSGETPLVRACRGRHADVAAVLIEHGADVDASNGRGETPLSEAAWAGHRDVAELLLEHGATGETADGSDITPVHLAAIEGHREIALLLIRNGVRYDIHAAALLDDVAKVRQLLDAGVPVDARLEGWDGVTPLVLTAAVGSARVAGILLEHGAQLHPQVGGPDGPEEISVIGLAAKNGHADVLRALAEAGADVTGLHDGESALVEAIEDGHLEAVRALLEMGADPNNRPTGYDAPLVVAARSGTLEIVKLLVEAGAEVVGEGLDEALWSAAEQEDMEIVEYLLDAAADSDGIGREGGAALAAAISTGSREMIEALLEHGVDINAEEIPAAIVHRYYEEQTIEQLAWLVDHGLDLNSDAPGYTLLHLFIVRGHDDAVRWCLEHGADPDRGEHPLCGTALICEVVDPEVCDIATVRLLIEHGADVNARRDNGETALHWAVHNNLPDVVAALLEAGADPNVQADEGYTPMHIAAWDFTHDATIPRLLVEHGGDVTVADDQDRTPLGEARGDVHDLFREQAMPPIVVAAKHGDLAGVQALLEDGADPNAADDHGRTALHWAARGHHTSVVELLLAKGAHSSVKDGEGLTPLHVVLLWNAYAPRSLGITAGGGLPIAQVDEARVELVRALIEHGADVSEPTPEGALPIELAAERDAFGVVKLLAEHGADVSRLEGHRNLWYWCMEGDAEVVQFLVDCGLDMDSRDSYGMRPLHWAAYGNNQEAARVLVESGAEYDIYCAGCLGDVDRVRELLADGVAADERGPYDRTPLHGAALNGHVAAAQVLIDAGADPDAPNQDGWTPLMYALPAEAVAELLLRSGADIEARDNEGSTALLRRHWVSDDEHLGAIRWLLDHGADPQATNDKGNTFLHVVDGDVGEAVPPGDEDVAVPEGEEGGEAVKAANLVLESGADVSAANTLGWTPLHRAASEGYVNLAELFIEHGADVDARTNTGRTPLHVAAWNGHLDIIKLLEESGADMNAQDDDGQTPLHKAAMRAKARRDVSFGGPAETYDYLERVVDFDIRDNEGRLAIDWLSSPAELPPPEPSEE